MRRTWTIPGVGRGSGVTEIRCVLDDEPIRVTMRGEVDLLTKPALDDLLALLARRTRADVLVDLRPASLLSCVGVSFLDAAAEQRAPWGGTVYVRVSPGPVTRILELLGVDDLVTIVHTSPDPGPPA
ncbi:MAG: hypothetical protein QOJ50_1588 [Cryptosporangiaceae bacterium]|jgi:anti-anti-sigma factor|nr:hypothetical protein [Cryptosporangiaceae bacterium]